jgi:hypothetical protein
MVTTQTTPDLSRAMWRKSTRSNYSGECVEVANLTHHIAVRDSKDPVGPKLIFNRQNWRQFTEAVREGGYEG